MERTGRFSTILGVDTNKAALDTFVRNHGTGSTPPDGHLGDVRELLQGPVWDVLGRHGVHRAGDLDCLVGGPPCEGFSRNTVYTRRGSADEAGVMSAAPVEYRESKYWQSAWASETDVPVTDASRMVRAYNPFLTDPRNLLFRAFLDVAEALQPRIVLIENVRQILTHGGGEIAAEIAARLGSLGYWTDARILNAAEYGVPQIRHRAFFLAIRKDLVESEITPSWPDPTHSAARSGPWPQACLDIDPTGALWPGDRGLFVTTAEAIGDLPTARPEREGNPRLPVDAYADARLSDFRRFVRSSIATPDNHVHRTPSEQVIRRLRAMRPGMRLHNLPADLQTRKYYYNAYGRLDWDLPANTVTKSFLYPGSGRFGHPEMDRVISYREAARLQSFDDDFTFYASSQEGLASMIGSAVPPLLGFRLGAEIAGLLDACDRTKLTRAS